MKRAIIILGIILVILLTFWLLGKKSEVPIVQAPSLENKENSIQSILPKIASDIPLPDPKKRITKKLFGILVNPQDSPIEGEIFSGYHTGVDLETFPEEADVDVEVRAICEGEILQKKRVSGYGGAIAQNCTIKGEKVVILYGHLKLNDASAQVGKIFSTGEKLAILGAGGSVDTDGERKHLHLGIKKGQQVDWRGYVSSKKELANWIDPEKIVFPPVL